MTIGSGPCYTYHHVSMENSSYIDHILISTDLLDKIESSAVLDPHPCNTGDHLPVTITLKVSHPQSNLETQVSPNTPTMVPKFMWKNSLFTNKYKEKVKEHLTNYSSKDLSIDDELTNFYEILKNSARESLIELEQNHHKISPKRWWNSNLTKAKKLVQQMFNAWKIEGFPRDGDNVSYNRFKLARKSFRQHVRTAKHQSTVDYYIDIDTLKKTKPKTYWKTLKVHKSQNSQKLFTINGKTTKQEIISEFTDHFSSILNKPGIESVDNTKSNDDLTEILKGLTPEEDDFYVSQSEVEEAISQLNRDKSPDPFHILSEHFIHAISSEFLQHTTHLINRIFSDTDTALSLSLSIIIPLVKSNNRSLKDPNNYRGISIISTLLNC